MIGVKLEMFSSLVVALLLAASARAQPLPPATLDVNLSAPSAPFEHVWKRSFGSGHALLATRADWRAHLDLAIAELGLAGLRFHGTLDDDMSVTLDGASYYWYNVDAVYDHLVAKGVTPIVELSFMPAALANCSSGDDDDGGDDDAGGDAPACADMYVFGDKGGYKGLAAPPKDFDAWRRLVQALASHFVERHGAAEVARWRFEVWNEMWGVSFPEPYMALYNASAAGVKAAHPALKVGGPATMRLEHLDDFVARAAALGAPVDFVSSHFYPSDPRCAASDDWDCFARAVAGAAANASAAGLPFALTEFKEGLMGGLHDRAHCDTAYAAAFAARNVALLAGGESGAAPGLDVLSWWTFSDLFEEHGLRGEPFDGSFGLITALGVRKPAWRAFEALAKAGGRRVRAALDDPLAAAGGGGASTLSALATRDGDAGAPGGGGALHLHLANFAPMAGATARPWEPVSRNLTVRVLGLPPPAGARSGAGSPQAYYATLTTIDDDATDPYAQWLAMGSPAYPDAGQIAALHAASEPAVAVVPLADDGALELELKPYSVVHVEIAPAAA